MLNDVMMRLMQRVTEDADFRTNALLNLEETLDAGGFCLSTDELAAMEAFQAQVLHGAKVDLGVLSIPQNFCNP